MNTQLTMEQVKESFKLINTALNKSCKEGVFTIDEAYIIKIATNNLDKFIESKESPLTNLNNITSNKINNISAVNKNLSDDNKESK